MQRLTKILPYGLGALILVVAALVGPSLADKKKKNHPPGNPPPVNPVRPTSTSPPLIGQPSYKALYVLVADGLVTKLKPNDLNLTVRESQTLISATADALQTKLRLALPMGFTTPVGIPTEWLENPVFTSFDHYAFRNKLREANLVYIQNLINRLTNEYGQETLQMLSEQFDAVRTMRMPGDEDSLSFIKALYGNDFVNDFANANKETVAVKKKTQNALLVPTARIIIPSNTVAQVEAEISSVWRTEFPDADLIAVRDYIVTNDLAIKLRDDLQNNSMTIAEKGLMQKTMIGFRTLNVHTLSRGLITAKINLRSSTSNPKKK